MMQTTGIEAAIHKCERAKRGQAGQRAGLRGWIARLNGWTVAWYTFLTLAGVASNLLNKGFQGKL